MLVGVVRDKTNRGVYRYFNQGETGSGNGKQQFRRPESRNLRHHQTGQRYQRECKQHRPFVADTGDIRRHNKGDKGNGQIFEGFQNTGRGRRYAVVVLNLQNHRSDAVEQDSKHEIIEKQGEFNAPVSHLIRSVVGSGR